MRSPVAAGRVLNITAPDDVRLLQLRDLGPVKPIKPILQRPDYQAIAQPILASEFVRFVGEPIAAVVAPTAAEAEDAAERVQIDIEATSHVTDIDAALALECAACSCRSERMSNVIVEGRIEAPDLSALLTTAAAVIEQEVISHRQNATPIEARGIHAAYDTASRRIVATCATQNPHIMRTGIADVLGIPESNCD